MFGLSFMEILVAMVVSFLIFGPEQFPVMLKKAIQHIGTFKRYMYKAQNSFNDFTRDIEKDFAPDKWTGSSDSVEHSGYDEQEEAAAVVADLSSNPDDYETESLSNWRWQSEPKGDPSKFDPQPFDWKTQEAQA